MDEEGEWHFDQASRQLYLMLPAAAAAAAAASSSAAASGTARGDGVAGAAAGAGAAPTTSRPASVTLITPSSVLITQTDTLLRFLGSSSKSGSRVENVAFANVSFGYTSAQFFRPHEETSGGDYATHRSGAVKVENATGLSFVGNDFQWVGGNGIFLSNSVRNTTVSANLFQFIGTSGVAVQGKTGIAMMDGRDGERMMAAHGAGADNGVRLPTYNLVAHNVFADFGVWDKQSACYHKALAPNNIFLNNVCFNASRHGVNFQDGFGGGGVAEGNVFFNLNRETNDTTALNAWNRRNYVTSSDADPAVAQLIPTHINEWRRNLVLARNFYGVQDGIGDGIRNDDGSSFFTHQNNIILDGQLGLQFNGGTEVSYVSNLLIHCGWHLTATPDVARSFNNTVVDFSTFADGKCSGFWTSKGKRGKVKPGLYFGDGSLWIKNSTGGLPSGGTPVDFSNMFCGLSLEEWQNNSQGQDMHTAPVVAAGPGDPVYGSTAILAQARAMLWENRTDARNPFR